MRVRGSIRGMLALVSVALCICCGQESSEPDVAPTDTWPSDVSDTVEDVGQDARPEVDATDVPGMDAADDPDLSDVVETGPGWVASEVAVPGACAALEPDRLLDGSLRDRATNCGERCTSISCARLCARGGGIAAPCSECVVRTAECMVQLCPDCDADESCGPCFEESCEADWLVCAGVLAPEVDPPQEPPPPGCASADSLALVSSGVLTTFDDCRDVCPAVSGRYGCLAECMVASAELSYPCGECFSEWGACLDVSACAPCVEEPLSPACLRCAPDRCHDAFGECTNGVLELNFDPPDPGNVRLFNATVSPGLALVRLPTGEPLARRVPSNGISPPTSVEPDSFDVATTRGAVGPGAPPVASAELHVATESKWVVFGFEDVAITVEELPALPGVRQIRFFNATETMLYGGVEGEIEVPLDPLSISDPIELGLGEFRATFGTETASPEASVDLRSPGPSASWIVVVYPSFGAPLEAALLVLDESGGFFAERLALLD